MPNICVSQLLYWPVTCLKESNRNKSEAAGTNRIQCTDEQVGQQYDHWLILTSTKKKKKAYSFIPGYMSPSNANTDC